MNEYDYPLEAGKIAQESLPVRDMSKLLVYKDEHIQETVFKNLVDCIPEKSILIFNDTRVIPARIFFTYNDHIVELFCLEPLSPEVLPEKVLALKTSCTWLCMVGGARKWKSDTLSKELLVNDKPVTLTVTKGDNRGNAYTITFNWNGDVSFGDILQAAGAMPLPPYIKRAANAEDEKRYQTIYAKHKGSVAAPTAGLHFTDGVFESLDNKHISRAYITLHVGAGTFKPVKSTDIAGHTMHEEVFSIDYDTLTLLSEHIEQCIAVGTTTLRTVESIYWCGVRISRNETEPLYIPQWYAYEQPCDMTYAEATDALKNYMKEQSLQKITARTTLVCVPGYPFRSVQAIITNFHQPRSTLLLLVDAFLGGRWKKVYDYATTHDFRFLSYGDGSLLFRH